MNDGDGTGLLRVRHASATEGCTTCVSAQRVARRPTQETYESGAWVRRRHDGTVESFRAPSLYDTDGTLKSAARVKAEAEWWSRHRMALGLNTVGPDGAEHLPIFVAAGSLPEMQAFGAMHDVQAAQAQHQTMERAHRQPHRSRELLERYEAANRESALQGYRAVATGALDAGATRAKEVFQSHGFDVSGPDAIHLDEPR